MLNEIVKFYMIFGVDTQESIRDGTGNKVRGTVKQGKNKKANINRKIEKQKRL